MPFAVPPPAAELVDFCFCSYLNIFSKSIATCDFFSGAFPAAPCIDVDDAALLNPMGRGGALSFLAEFCACNYCYELKLGYYEKEGVELCGAPGKSNSDAGLLLLPPAGLLSESKP